MSLTPSKCEQIYPSVEVIPLDSTENFDVANVVLTWPLQEDTWPVAFEKKTY